MLHIDILHLIHVITNYLCQTHVPVNINNSIFNLELSHNEFEKK